MAVPDYRTFTPDVVVDVGPDQKKNRPTRVRHALLSRLALLALVRDRHLTVLTLALDCCLTIPPLPLDCCLALQLLPLDCCHTLQLLLRNPAVH